MNRLWRALAALQMALAALLLPGPAHAQGRPEPEKEISREAIEAVEKANKPGAVPGAMVPVVPRSVDPDNIWVLDLSTGGRVQIALRPDAAPEHVKRIKTLTRQGFYDGTVFHRVIDGFMAQGGDPTATGTGGSKLPDLKAEFNDLPHVRGAVSMARANSVDSANSQFFIVLFPALKLDHNYTVFGRVMSGMEWADAIEKGEPPANPSKIVQASMASDNKPAPAPQSPIPAVKLSTPSIFDAPTAAPAPAAAAAPKPKSTKSTKSSKH